jgi:hypothetical protein
VLNGPPNYWPDTDNARNYLLFAERCRELVSSESDDIYRIHALSTPNKLSELIHQCTYIGTHGLPKKALEPIVKEVADAVNSDVVVQQLIPDEVFKSRLIPCVKQTVDEISAKTKLILDLIDRKYRDTCEVQIEAAANSDNQKDKLQLLAKLYISEMINYGFSRQYIHEACIATFFEGRVSRCDKYLLRKFFRNFPNQPLSFTVFFSGNPKSIQRINQIFKGNEALSFSELRTKYKLSKSVDLKDNGDLFCKFENVKAYDIYTAVEHASSFLVLPKGHYILYPGNDPLIVNDEVLVIENKKNPRIVKQSDLLKFHNSVTAKRYVPSAKGFSKFISRRVTSDDYEHFGQMISGLRSAMLSMDTDHNETKLLMIWSGFEALLPRPPREIQDKPRVVHFVDLISPCVAGGYLKGKYRIFHAICSELFGKKYTQVIDDHGVGNTGGERLASILIGDNNHQELLCKALSSSPLALKRVYSLHQILENPEKAIKKIDSHEARVRWQIHRIYRERNFLVHSGNSTHNLGVLVENAELYFRLVLRSLEAVEVKFNIRNPYSALTFISEIYSARKSTLLQISKSRQPNYIKKKKFVKEIFK